MQHDDGDGRHNDGDGRQDNWRHDGTTMARGSRVSTTMVTGDTTTATGGTTTMTGGTTTARGRKRQQHHHHQRTNRSTIVNTFTSPDNLILFKLICSI